MQEQTKRTSQILQELVDAHPKSGQISVNEFVERLSDRTFGLGILIFGLINAFVPGASVIFTAPIFIIAGQMILGQHKLWIPKWLGKKSFSEEIVDKVLKKIIPSLKLVEKFIRPRMTRFTDVTAEKFMAIIIILLNILVLPPIPGLNMIPSLCCCLMALALLENDGLLGLISFICSIIVTAFYYGAVILVVVSIINGADISAENYDELLGSAINKMHENVK